VKYNKEENKQCRSVPLKTQQQPLTEEPEAWPSALSVQRSPVSVMDDRNDEKQMTLKLHLPPHPPNLL
jgi:hypothetical protein